MKTEVNIIKEHRNNKTKTAYRSDLLEASMKAIFINKKIHIFSATNSVKGTCVDIVQGDFCIIDASYTLFSTTDPSLSMNGKSSYMMIPKFGKNVAILED